MDFSRYTLVSQLSGGRYGAIWRAHDPQLARDVALKQLALADPDRRPTIMAAARAATALQHLNVARTYEPVEDEDTIWLVEEWIDGASLAALSSPGVQLAVQQGLGVVHGALEGLADAHRHGVVHGTVSPRTIMVDLAGTAKLIEFGAWLGHPDAAGIGAYASPEAFAGENLAATADVYSAGAVISELLRGQAAADPERAAQVTSDIRPVLDRAMSADPSARQPDAQTLLDELDRAAERVFGAAWWTTEGLGAVVASTAGASLASGTAAGGAGALAGSSSAAGSGGFGAVSGSMNLQGGGAVAGATAPLGGGGVLGGSAKQVSKGLGKKGLIAVLAGGLVLVVVTAAAIVATRDRTVQANPAAENSPPVVQTQPSSSVTPTPTPTPAQNPARNFKGIYTFVAVVIKSTAASVAVGSRQTAAWSVETTCNGNKCTSKVFTGTGGTETLTSTGGGWNTKIKGRGNCINLSTGRRTGQSVPNLYTRTLKPAKSTNGQIVQITGTDRSQQLKKCRNQVAKNYDVIRKITIRYKK
jgi:eukaryotic-like serine/threonine-protein kinase